ncbi:sigma E positive regulator RseC/MucC [Kangiella profundi]|uniref:Sigma E positive regulator RseC/MucC n=1 Tax=Kangiella profundi TaxID=1561924 RepID=A0A2K9AT51_9GAMM|nr:SoxR reducing system RseC family protein [Kangiella profundi]AUD78341.1 sigma E positive regulator RseC/MucC [Kangiella profundi]GGF07188.1 sigma factor RpoE regulatory protein RseC [Kangiella profundi]
MNQSNMLTEIGRVVAKENDTVWVQTQSKTGCSSCQVNTVCGSGIVSKAFSHKVFVTPLKNKVNANIDDEVEVGIPDNLVVRASFMVYLVPLISMILALLVWQFWLTNSSELSSILAAATGLAIGFVVTHLYSRYAAQNGQTEPVLLRIVKRPIAVKQIETTVD